MRPEFARYHRQMLLPLWGDRGQDALTRAHIAIVGAGALGSVVAEQLCRAGVGTLTLIDRDIVERTNLQRQALYAEADVGRPKVEAAAARLGQINSAVRTFAEATDLRSENAEAALGILADRPAVIVDGTDNFETRYLLNDVAVKHSIPFVYAGAVAMTGTTATLRPPQTCCLRCLQPTIPEPGTVPTCDTAGVFGSMTALIASLQAAEVLKLIVSPEQTGEAALVSVNLATSSFQRLGLGSAKDPHCPCCGARDFAFLNGVHDSTDRALCGRNTVQISPQTPRRLDLSALSVRLSAIGKCQLSGRALHLAVPRDEDSAFEVTVFQDGRVLVGGTMDVAQARAIASRVLG